MDETWHRDRDFGSVRGSGMRRRFSPLRNDRDADGPALVHRARVLRGGAYSDSVAQRRFLPCREADQNYHAPIKLRDLLPEGGVTRGQQRVFAGVPAQEMRRARVRSVMFAAGPDFVEQKSSRLVRAAVQVILETAFLFARGTNQGAKFGFEKRFLAIPGAEQDDECKRAFWQLRHGCAAPFRNVSPPLCNFLWFSFGHDGGDCTPTGRKSNRELAASGRWQEGEGNGRRDAIDLRDLRKRSFARVDPEHDDAVGVLVFGEQELARGVDGEVPGFFATRREFTGRLKLAAGGVNGEDRDRVVAAVRGEEPFAVRVKSNFGRVVASLKSFRQGRHHLR